MSGLALMSLGPFQFRARGFGFNARQRSQRTPWAAIPVAGGFDRLQWTGGEGRTETISGVIFSEDGGEAALAGIRAASRIGRALPLVDMSGNLSNVFGMHVVEAVEEDMGPFQQSGAPLRTAYSIKLRGYEADFGTVAGIPILGFLA